ncbi:FAD-dependent oxidoreductase [Flagellimonas sp. HMM57]|uniref:flavin monoamine oxidase family protein n=1 Tax=unclassified Flagellimonas TaxID=2644544 RepID=UPI0013D85CC2|nr:MULTISPECIES: NAD(P)/FAD-dependent oxidoreductase [unclassified Flagellimonas]UII74842.1 FAD-dependent oxidoreductase [Flagellimonas sp. HMM57]
MNKHKLSAKYIIVGAGLSGLTTANSLLETGEDDFIILEGRNHIGGRINTHKGIDMGATWFQDHHLNLNKLLDRFNINIFEQYGKGQSVLVYNTMAPAHFFENSQEAPSASRVVNGTTAIVEKLAMPLKDKIIRNTKIIEVTEVQHTLHLKTENDIIFSAEKVVVTVPPKLASTLKYSPGLPTEFSTTMKHTHTWMSNAIKVGLLFEKAFWREKNFSGTVIGQVGPIIELYDHCNYENSIFGLMGFANEGLRDFPKQERKKKILDYLEKYLGKEIKKYTLYLEKDWSKDRFTSCENLKSVYMSPQYGNPLFNDFYMDGKLFFSGTETSPVYGGYLDGAVYSGIRAAEKLTNKVLT